MLTDKEIISYTWHDKMEDKLSSWKYVAGLLNLNLNANISPQDLKKCYQRYFQEIVGIKPFTKCPLCEKALLPRKSKYGYFVGCSDYPNCKFIATPTKPYKKKL